MYVVGVVETIFIQRCFLSGFVTYNDGKFL